MVDRFDATGTEPVLPNVTQPARDAFQALHRVVRLNAHAMVKRFSGEKAHAGQVGCLRVLSAHDGITQRDMAAMLHVSRPSITAMLQAAEKSGAVVRRPDESDQRLTRVYLTEDGRALAGKLTGVLGEYVAETIGTMPEADQQELTRLLDDLAERIERTMTTTDESE